MFVILKRIDKTHLLTGAEEACWAHNPKVLGSKPSGAILFILSLFYFFLSLLSNQDTMIFHIHIIYTIRTNSIVDNVILM